MISVNIAVFIAFLLGGPLIVAFVLHLLNNKWFLSEEKKLNLNKVKCEICDFPSYAAGQLKYWRCPVCRSLNKNNKK